MSQIEVFNNEEFGSIRVIEENGKYYYVRGVFRLETGIYAPVERPDDPPGKPRHRPTRQPDPH